MSTKRTKKSEVKTTGYILCMFCGGQGTHENAEACRIKSIAASALYRVLDPSEAMMILDRTPFLKEIEQIIEKRKS